MRGFMTRNEFARLFEVALEEAARNAEKALSRDIPRVFKIRLHAAGLSGELLNVSSALEALYLGEDKFFRIIDLMVIEVNSTQSIVFVRPSSHTPSSFHDTWNDPPGMGPFKQIIAEKIKYTEP